MKKYIRSNIDSCSVNKLHDVVYDILDEFKYNVGEPMTESVINHIANNITFDIADYDDIELTEIAQQYEGTDELRSLIVAVCKELELL